ncbi:MAG: hypothetical protein HYX48_06480 [Chlamydiales bacterium]|nr:hypothetical protein [Chlamydiales bacterium]
MSKKISYLLLIFSLVFQPHLRSDIPSQPEKKICLTMVVKDDEAVIEHCLNSVKDIVDCISICDLGSTDETLRIVEDFLLETGIPGTIHKGKQRNIAHDKTLSIKAAQKVVKTLGFPLGSTYLLDLNADMKLNLGSGFKKEALKEDAYLLLEKSSTLSVCSFNAHLLRASLVWESIGAVHGYWDHKGSYKSEKLHTLSIEDHGSPAYKAERLQRELALLVRGIQDEPDNLHYQFYLAQTHKALKHYEDAIGWYKMRLNGSEMFDEAWCSRYMIGECYQEMGQWEPALFWYLDAFRYNPGRADSLLKVANYYRHKGQNDLAYLFAKHGARIPRHDFQLSGWPPFSDYQLAEEISIAAYYTRFKEEGGDAANDLILKKNAPWQSKDQAYRNLLFYIQNIPHARFQPIVIERPLIQKGSDERYYPMNPSIRKTEAGYEVICRTVNYTQVGAKEFNTIDETGIFKTRNFLARYDRDLKLLSQDEIIENLPRERIHSFNIEGMDDCRIFGYNQASWFTCTTSDTNPAGNFQISLCKLADRAEKGVIQVEKLLPLKGPDPYRCEKNWLPFIKNGELLLIYSYDPFIIYKPDLESGECKTVVSEEYASDFGRFRGSAAPIEFDDGYLMLTHEVILTADYHRCYLHRFLYLDKNLKVKKLSKLFTFLHNGVEFCCSMSLNHTATELLLAVGIEDREAYLCSLNLESIRSMLYPIAEGGGATFFKHTQN